MHLKPNVSQSTTSNITMLLFAGTVLATYQYGKNPSPEFFLFFIQMALLWVILKIIFYLSPKSGIFVLMGLLGWGMIEAIWGLGQLYGYFPARHALFKITGSFLNPGPFGGFMALMIPLTLCYWLTYGYKNKWVGSLFLFAGCSCLIALPATLSRTAWIAAITGCLFVLLVNTCAIARLRKVWKNHKRQSVLAATVLGLLLIVSGYGIYHLKKDSADGRLFMWKISCLSIRESPVKGTGMGGFPAAYSKAQIEYFKNGNGSETEKLVAGSPEYAFNEYLQIFVEQGLFGIILFIMLTCAVIRSGIRNRQVGATGSFIALSVFAFASYPYQLWQFPVAWVLLGSVCTTIPGGKYEQTRRPGWEKTGLAILAVGILCILSVICASYQKVFFEAKKEWKKLQPLYAMKAYENVADDYEKLYPVLNFEAKFVFEYGIVLNATGQREKADSIFSRGIEISSDPMFYNVKGRNHHEMGEYHKAENCYMNSIRLLPERIYPYYLLTRLYAEPANYQPGKMRHAATAVLEKEPKVHSMAIMEMRGEVKKILKEKGVVYE